MPKCLRCGAGGEWISGKVHGETFSYQDEKLYKARLAVVEASRIRSKLHSETQKLVFEGEGAPCTCELCQALRHLDELEKKV